VSSLAVEFEELDDWLWCLRTPVVACYAIRDRGRVVLVDASVSGQHGAILEALADRLGAASTAVPVRQMLLTHAPPDHDGSAHQIALRSATEVLGPEQEADVFAGHAQLAAPRLADWERPLFEETMAHVPPAEPVELDRLLLPGDALDWEVGVELIGAAGHTPASSPSGSRSTGP
jgi:glyoxylase-like metal-dependent hydrolase (beta-lactamase superfamily II)